MSTLDHGLSGILNHPTIFDVQKVAVLCRCGWKSEWQEPGDEGVAAARQDHHAHRMDVAPPQRIRLSRTKGYRKPPGAIVVARPSKWGNPFRIAECIENGFASDEAQARRVCVEAFRDWLNGDRWADGCGSVADARFDAYLASLPYLRGHDLACWCPLDQPCHADVLLEVANAS